VDVLDVFSELDLRERQAKAEDRRQLRRIYTSNPPPPPVSPPTSPASPPPLPATYLATPQSLPCHWKRRKSEVKVTLNRTVKQYSNGHQRSS
jgi:hypothetical protein